MLEEHFREALAHVQFQRDERIQNVHHNYERLNRQLNSGHLNYNQQQLLLDY